MWKEALNWNFLSMQRMQILQMPYTVLRYFQHVICQHKVLLYKRTQALVYIHILSEDFEALLWWLNHHRLLQRLVVNYTILGLGLLHRLCVVAMLFTRNCSAAKLACCTVQLITDVKGYCGLNFYVEIQDKLYCSAVCNLTQNYMYFRQKLHPQPHPLTTVSSFPIRAEP